MSFKAKLFIEDQERNILDAHLLYHRFSDLNGKPTSNPIGGPLRFSIESTGNDSLFYENMFSPSLQCQGEIIFYKRDGLSTLFKIEFANAHFLGLEENFSASGDEPLHMNITIGWGIIKVRGVVFEEYWNPNNPFVEQAAPTEIGDPGPIVTQISWIDPETDETIEEQDYAKSVSLQALIENPAGGSAKIVIEKEDGSEFENGKKQLDFDATVNSDGIAEVTEMDIKVEWQELKTADIDKLIAKVEYLGTSKKSEKLTLLPKAKVLVNFRVHNNYTGEFGFDWLRMGDTGKPGDIWYKVIIGAYTTGSFVQSDSEYVKLGGKFDQLAHPTKTNDKYIVPVLTLLPSKKATFSLKVEVEEDAKKVEFVYDKNYLSLNQSEVTRKTKGKETLPDYLEVTCVKEFGSDQYIEVLADGEFAGKLKILANDRPHRYKADVILVKIVTNLNGTDKTGKATGETNSLSTYLNQALIKPNIDIKTLNLKTDPVLNSTYTLRIGGVNQINDITGIHGHLETEFNKVYPGLTSAFKVFLFDEPGGEMRTTGYQGYNGAAKAINSKSVVVYNTRGPSTTTHEILHAAGLYHTFSDGGEFTLEKKKTDNIMDYSHQVGIDRISTYQWQWSTIWPNVEKE